MRKQPLVKDLITRFSTAPENAVAFSLYDGENLRSVTYPTMVSDILKAADYFVSRGIFKKHIAIAAPNSYEWIVTFFGITASGNTAILLNPSLPNDMFTKQYRRADVSFVCCDDETFDTLCQCLPENECIRFSQISSDQELPIDSIFETDADDTIAMILTSGTTGKSKIVEISAENMKYSLENVAPCFQVDHMDRLYTPIPFFHISGFNIFLAILSQHKTECLGRGIKYLFMDLPKLNPTAMNTVPSITDSLLRIYRRAKNEEERRRFVGDSLRLIRVSGAALNPASCRFLSECGLDIAIFYGMSETTGAAAWMIADDKHIGSTGKFCIHTKYCIRDGELLLSGPFLMKGYYKNPEETAKLIEDGWIHTGDLARVDEDGYLYITGRKKNVIILSNGENVNPEEVEEKLGAYEPILECMVYGDAKGICADVYCENREAAASCIHAYNEDNPMYRQVYKVNYFDAPLEKTASGKIKRKENVYA